MRDRKHKKTYGAEDAGARRVAGASFSGHERNHLYLNRDGKDFSEVSGISGMDDPADARSFALFDYDRDGWQDTVVANANAPLLQLFRNQMGNMEGGLDQHMLALRFVGGNRTARPSSEWSVRDGFGALATIGLGDTTLKREYRAGEGLAAQNSSTVIVGIGERAGAETLTIRWPSGVEQHSGAVPADTLVTIYENPADSPTGAPFVFEPYRRELGPAPSVAVRPTGRRLELPGASDDSTARLRMYTTMATWCAACKGELPDLRDLRASFEPDQVEMYGVPIDQEEGTDLLNAYVETNAPSYQLLADLDSEERARVRRLVIEELQIDALPTTILTDSQGQVLRVLFGLPSVSELRRLMAATDGG